VTHGRRGWLAEGLADHGPAANGISPGASSFPRVATPCEVVGEGHPEFLSGAMGKTPCPAVQAPGQYLLSWGGEVTSSRRRPGGRGVAAGR
jgi:hypothetical protein